MGEKKKAVIKNTSIGFINQLVTMLFTFVTRSLFIKYIGVELLGLNSTFSSLLTALSLAELGFQNAIVFNLYKPLHDRAIDEINSIMNILKVVYRGLGVFFIIATFLVTPFLQYIVTGMDMTPLIYIFFWLQSLASVSTYFLAYKRAILYADQKEYISKIVDLNFSIIFNILQCVSLIIFKSYIGYLVLKVLQTYISNIIICWYCANHYKYLKKVPVDKKKLQKILNDVRDIFASRMASFIYNSTDNLVISAFISTIRVGFFVNYTTITTSLKALTHNILCPIIPILGNHLLDEKNDLKRENIFFLNTFVRYLMALLIVIPTGVLIDDFVIWWVGSNMVLGRSTVILLCFDFYIYLVHSASMDFINSAGLFKSDKYIEMLGAICNVITSLVFVQYLEIEGVLLGTVISQVVFWIGRSYIVYSECLKLGMKKYLKYWKKNICYIVVAILVTIIVYAVYQKIEVSNELIRFIIGGLISELIIIIMVVIFWGRSKEMKELKRIVLRK